MTHHRRTVLCTLGAAALAAGLLALAPGARAAGDAAGKDQGLAAFETVRAVLQHPRCQNCHIPGDAPLQLDEGRVHTLNVLRGPDGKGSPGLPCTTCHGSANLPASYGDHMPPGAPSWSLPPASKKMVFVGLAPAELCKSLKDGKTNGGKNLDALLEHMSNDKLVAWGWNPGPGRKPVPVPREEVIAKFKTWMSAGAPCPN